MILRYFSEQSLRNWLIVRKYKLMAQILVVDDSATVRNDVVRFLEQHELTVDTAIDGQDAFNKLAEPNDYRVAFVDINMPILDGLSLIEKVQSELSLPALNVIMLTTEFASNLKERGKAAGVKGWIVKPFNGTKIIDAIKKMIAK